jgi:hypothetical protein
MLEYVLVAYCTRESSDGMVPHQLVSLDLKDEREQRERKEMPRYRKHFCSDSSQVASFFSRWVSLPFKTEESSCSIPLVVASYCWSEAISSYCM